MSGCQIEAVVSGWLKPIDFCSELDRMRLVIDAGRVAAPAGPATAPSATAAPPAAIPPSNFRRLMVSVGSVSVWLSLFMPFPSWFRESDMLL